MLNTHTFGYPRRYRLLTSEDFQKVFDKVDYKVSNKNLLLLTRKNGQDTGRLGFIISKKNVKLAVTRNRIKRLTKEYFRHHQSIIPNLDIIVLVKKGMYKIENDVFVTELEALFKKLSKKAQI